MKNFLWIFAVVFGLAFAVPAMAAPEVPADGLKMEATKKPVVFNHSTHKDVTCASCHHPVDGKEDYRKCSTAGCHDDFKAKKGVNSYYAAMHGKKGKFDSCVSCHAKVVTEKAPGKAAELTPEQKAYKKKMTSCKGSGCHI